MGLSERLGRLEAIEPRDYCAHQPPIVQYPPDCHWERAPRRVPRRCWCGLPPLCVQIEYVEGADWST